MANTDRAPGGTADGFADVAAADPTAQLDQMLDEALRDTFPASDPISVVQPQPKSTE